MHHICSLYEDMAGTCHARDLATEPAPFTSGKSGTAIYAINDETHGRDYVDDIVAHSTGHNRVDNTQEVWNITAAFRSATTVVMNEIRSNRFATSAPDRRALEALPGPAVKGGFMDLGVPQYAVNKARKELSSEKG